MLESTSGLSAKEKKIIRVDLQDKSNSSAEQREVECIPLHGNAKPTSVSIPEQTSKRFSALQEMEDRDVNLLDDSDNEENVFSEENMDNQLRISNNVIEAELQHMAHSPQPGLERFPDDSFEAKSQADDNDKIAEEYYWSEGEKDDAMVERSETS
ncbi:OLC1v1036047C1 [Oldenlandia corymbosa var. corymbosa]|uniref:OLC1v1036047C1 n=1 Tax=Oldenlandia corymbosa var. corymbosa TaxID=529605 RepID=A0AAV1CUH7_OLDCO|nr:OLC1v1036047C1 [Oldenlandia corymbosa var. corymbosa]